jgi:2-polyprenyl-3-methyl-5-hydroxy-6-metoxy-1,4-benzoquinol methylase
LLAGQFEEQSKSMSAPAQSLSPDASARGLLDTAPDAGRYGGYMDEAPPASERFEVSGIMRRWMPTNVRVLDIGCGSGTITLETNRDKNNSVLCVEPDPVRAEISASRGLEVICGLADQQLLRERGPFDVIVFSDVLEHLAAPADMIELAASGLAPGGFIMASVPNVAHWTVRLKLLIGRFDYASSGIMDATHLRWFTEKTVRALFASQGFDVLSISASAGTWMGTYKRFPFNLLPERMRDSLVVWLTRVAPNLFGCQHVIKAERSPNPA